MCPNFPALSQFYATCKSFKYFGLGNNTSARLSENHAASRIIYIMECPLGREHQLKMGVYSIKS